MPQKKVQALVSKKGEHDVGEYTLRVEKETTVQGLKLPSVSLWKAGNCCYKGTVNPHLFEIQDITPDVSN